MSKLMKKRLYVASRVLFCFLSLVALGYWFNNSFCVRVVTGDFQNYFVSCYVVATMLSLLS